MTQVYMKLKKTQKNLTPEHQRVAEILYRRSPFFQVVVVFNFKCIITLICVNLLFDNLEIF